MAGYNLADLFELVADAVGQREAIVCGDRRLTYLQLEERANRLAHVLSDRGIVRGDHVGLQLLNGTEYVEGMLACFKLRAVPVNVNFRYVEAELAYLYDDADLKALICHRSFASRAEAARTPRLRDILVVGDEDGAGDYEQALTAASAIRDYAERSGDDLYIAYTGGTTGMPKGVLWRQEDIFYAGMGGGDIYHSGNTITEPAQLLERIPDPGFVALATPPFMHVSAHWLVFSVLFGGGKMVVTPYGRFDPPLIWQLVGDEHVNMLIIVGDAMARPLADALEAGSYDTSSLIVVGSGGAVLSPSTKQRLSALLPNQMIVDGFGSSETGTLGSQMTAQGMEAKGARFPRSEHAEVLDDDLRPVEPGSGVIGRLARRGRIPIGYHKDPDKTAATFVEADGTRWVIPGDHGTVEADGTIVLLGRGSVSINTGGEKVFPEEVEVVVKDLASVRDAVVVGVPDERWGERVVAVVRPADGATPTLEELQAHCRTKLAGYKVPRDICFVDEIVRSPAGKTDYRWAREQALAAP